MFRHLLHSIPRTLSQATQVCHIMVGWITNVPGLLRCGNGPHELRLSPSFDTSTAVYCGVLRLYHVNPGVCLEASQHHSHLILRSRSTCLSALVLDQLLPYGIYWTALCHIVWCKASNSMDDWLEKSLDYKEYRIFVLNTFHDVSRLQGPKSSCTPTV